MHYADYVLPMGVATERHDLMSQETHAGRWIGATHQLKLGFEVENERYYRELDRGPDLDYYTLVDPFGPDIGVATARQFLAKLDQDAPRIYTGNDEQTP